MLDNKTFDPEVNLHADQTTKKPPKHAVNDCVHWLRYIRNRRWSRRQKHALITHFKDVQAAASATHEDTCLLTGRPPLRSADVDERQVQAELAWLEHENHHLISVFDPHYPELLKHIDDPPIALFALGDRALLSTPKVAIVGSRRPTPIGERMATDIAKGLSSVGVAVVSGMALGIDGIAHQAALAVNGPTIAVVGSGIDVVYPRRNAGLYRSLCDKGLIISEYPFGFQPSKYTFPDRNRLVSGLSLGVVIVEAAEHSGTLITARLAAEQNRELMVVPGAAFSEQYRGSHRLIKDGANLVCCVGDVLTQLSVELSAELALLADLNAAEDSESSALVNLSKQELRVIQHIGYESTVVDQLIERTGLNAAELSDILLGLEMQGAVATTREGGYIRVA